MNFQQESEAVNDMISKLLGVEQNDLFLERNNNEGNKERKQRLVDKARSRTVKLKGKIWNLNKEDNNINNNNNCNESENKEEIKTSYRKYTISGYLAEEAFQRKVSDIEVPLPELKEELIFSDDSNIDNNNNKDEVIINQRYTPCITTHTPHTSIIDNQININSNNTNNNDNNINMENTNNHNTPQPQSNIINTQPNNDHINLNNEIIINNETPLLQTNNTLSPSQDVSSIIKDIDIEPPILTTPSPFPSTASPIKTSFKQHKTPHQTFTTNIPINSKQKQHHKSNSINFTLTETHQSQCNTKQYNTIKHKSTKQSPNTTTHYKRKTNSIIKHPKSNSVPKYYHYKTTITKPFLERQVSFLKKIESNRTKLKEQIRLKEKENILKTSYNYNNTHNKKNKIKGKKNIINDFNSRNKEWELKKQNKIATMLKQKKEKEEKEIKPHPYKRHKVKYTKQDIKATCERLCTEEINKRLINQRILRKALEPSFKPNINQLQVKKYDIEDNNVMVNVFNNNDNNNNNIHCNTIGHNKRGRNQQFIVLYKDKERKGKHKKSKSQFQIENQIIEITI